MEAKRSIILYWFLLLVPTVIIGVAAFRLLSHEQERIDRAAEQAASDRGSAIADAIRITIEGVEEELTRSLYQIGESRLKEELLLWEESNPLIRNVFVWEKESKLLYPLDSLASTAEERRFVKRYEALFSGRIPWQHKNNVSSDLHRGTGISGRLVRPEKTARQRLIDLAGNRRSESLYVQSGSPEPGIERDLRKDGWIPWFSENRLYILGWVQRGEREPVYGVELELMTLLSRLVTDFPENRSTDVVYALADGTGLILHQSGPSQIDADKAPDISIPLTSCLPHWRVGVYFVGDGPSHSGRYFIYLSGLLLAIFITAILSGGFLLTRQANRNMKDAMQKTSFVSSVSHELKTPLTSIRMYAELLQAGRVRDSEKRGRYLSVIVSESRRLTRLVNNVLDFGRLEQGKKRYHFETFDLAEFVTVIVEAQRLRISEAGMALCNNLPEGEFSVESDRDAVEQVILNLIDNAIKYAADGGVINVSLATDAGGCYRLKICDRGPGIPPAHRRAIFEKFHRVDNRLTSGKPGSGLGLSIARRILRDLGGDLTYEPAPEKGSCFIAAISRKSQVA